MVSIMLVSLQYHSSMHKFYQNLAHLPGFVLLESADRTRGRYDILSAYPYDQIKIDQHTTDFESSLRQFKENIAIRDSLADLPFQGGAIGYISYDFGARLLGINSKPLFHDMPLVNLGLYDWAIIVDHLLKKVTLFAENKTHLDEILTLWHTSTAEDKPATLIDEFQPLMTKEAYQSSLSDIHQALVAGRSYQVNFTQAFQTEFTGDSWTFYKRVSRKNPVPFAAFLRTDEAEILSFSPERFLLYEEGKLLTSPIKGTMKRAADPVEDLRLSQELLASEKNQAENVMIVDLLRNDLGQIAKAGSVNVSALLALESYHSVHHLVSTIEAECKPEIHPLDAFLACFPGGSITGAPKREAMTIIHEQEPQARGVYCGAIGYFSRHAHFDTNIAIRTLTAKKKRLHIAAGGGIVIDSDSDDEYRECLIKIAAVIHGLKEG